MGEGGARGCEMLALIQFSSLPVRIWGWEVGEQQGSLPHKRLWWTQLRSQATLRWASQHLFLGSFMVGLEDNQGWKGEHIFQGPACFNGRTHLYGFLAPFPSSPTPPASTSGCGHFAAAQLALGLLLSFCVLRYWKCNFILILDEKEWEWQ